MAVTIKKIAELAGVSAGTVDRALHDRGRVDPAVAGRIKELARELNYKPNTVAKGLRAKRTNITISVILHIQHTNSFFIDVIKGVEQCRDEIADYGITVDIRYCPDFDALEQLKLIDDCVNGGTSGIVIVPINHPLIMQRLNELHELHIPVLFLTNIVRDTEYLSFVGCNYTLSGRIGPGLLNLVSPADGKLLCFSPSFQMYGHILRSEGLQNQLEKCYPQIKLQDTIELTGIEIRDYQKTQEALKQYPGTNLFVCLGAYSKSNLQAIKDMGFFQTSKIICYDFSRTIGDEILQGNITATITQQPQLQGYTAVKTLFEYLITGKEDIPKNNYIKTRILLKEHLEEIEWFTE